MSSQQEISSAATRMAVALIIGLIIGTAFTYGILSMTMPQAPSAEYEQQIKQLKDRIAELEAQLAEAKGRCSP